MRIGLRRDEKYVHTVRIARYSGIVARKVNPGKSSCGHRSFTRTCRGKYFVTLQTGLYGGPARAPGNCPATALYFRLLAAGLLG